MPSKKYGAPLFTVANHLPAYCNKCHYKGTVGATETCDYLLQTRRRRPGPVGKGCTVRKEKTGCEKNWNQQICLQ